MKNILISILIICNPAVYIICQNPIWVLDPEKNYQIPMGECSWDSLVQGEFFEEMQENYMHYSPDSTSMAQINNLLTQKDFQTYRLRIQVFFGAWCSDSREHLPHLIKITDQLSSMGYNCDIQLFGCNRNKKTGDSTLDKLVKIEYVPTIFFDLYDETLDELINVGTLIETPLTTVEGDLSQMLYYLQMRNNKNRE